MRLRVRVLGYTLLSLTFDAHEMLELIATEDESTQDEADPPPNDRRGQWTQLRTLLHRTRRRPRIRIPMT